ncbi:MAG: metal-dependent hydrolase [Aquabacterium sp.]
MSALKKHHDDGVHTDTQSLTVRHLDVDLSQGFPTYWYGNDAYKSTLLNALSFMFPVGEQFFIDSVRRYAKDVEAKGLTKLAKEIKLFIGQEATHRHLHQQYNDQLVAKGYDAWVERTLQRVIHAARHFPAINHLAATAAYEHYTAVLGDGLLRHDEWTRDMEPTMREVWLWHAAEESEHKAVALDTYNAVGGGYIRRVIMYVLVTIEFYAYTWIQVVKMLHKDRQLFKLKTWGSALRFWFGRKGVFWHMLPHQLAYFKPGFHPWQHNNEDLLHRWQQEHADAYRTVARPHGKPHKPSAGHPA